MLVVLLVSVHSFLASLGLRRDLMLENLPLRHQLQVALRTRTAALLYEMAAPGARP
jgi:hypothetical protein